MSPESKEKFVQLISNPFNLSRILFLSRQMNMDVRPPFEDNLLREIRSKVNGVFLLIPLIIYYPPFINDIVSRFSFSGGIPPRSQRKLREIFSKKIVYEVISDHDFYESVRLFENRVGVKILL